MKEQLENPKNQLSKDDFINGRHDEMIIKAGLEHLMVRNSVEKRLSIRDEMLKTAPLKGPIWVFAYGSLIWNPAFDVRYKKLGTLYGYHRSFCFWSKVGRGSPEKPGMMLGLERGGACSGILLGVERQDAKEELTSVFMREMTGQTYLPKWGSVKTTSGWVKAITFVSNQSSENYVGRRPLEEVASHISRGAGHLGSCSDYLFNTTQHLQVLGLRDQMLENLCRLVERARSA